MRRLLLPILFSLLALNSVGRTPPPGGVMPTPFDTTFQILGCDVKAFSHNFLDRNSSTTLMPERMSLEMFGWPSKEAINLLYVPMASVNGKAPDDKLDYHVFIAVVKQRPDGVTTIGWMYCKENDRRSVHFYLANYDAQGCVLDVADLGNPSHYLGLLKDCDPKLDFDLRNSVSLTVSDSTAGVHQAISAPVKRTDRYLMNSTMEMIYDIDAEGHFAGPRLADSTATLGHKRFPHILTQADSVALGVLLAGMAPRSQADRLDAWNRAAEAALKAPKPQNQLVPYVRDLAVNFNALMWNADPAAYLEWLAKHKKDNHLAELTKLCLDNGSIEADHLRLMIEKQPKKQIKTLNKLFGL